jgi:hypothetical protein
LDSLPQGLFSAHVLVAWASSLLLVVHAIRRRGHSLAPALALLGLLGLMSAEIFFVSLAGDGLFDFPKHNHLLFSVLLGFYAVAVCALLPLAIKWYQSHRK